MSRLDYLNVGSGSKFHQDWTNVDMVSTDPHVQAHNLLVGFPFTDNSFDVVYHSQVLEHFSREAAPHFLGECFRVLRPNGILRVVVPDLENIASEYLRLLRRNLEQPNPQTEADYDWIMLEMYDQTVRNHSGGDMQRFLSQPRLINEAYVLGRAGRVGRMIRANGQQLIPLSKNAGNAPWRAIRRLATGLYRSFWSEARKLGEFRLGGEVHLWMYDRFSLSRLLRATGFVEIEVRTPYSSNIPDWATYELDVKDGSVCDPTSLFIEARKPPL